MALLSISAAQKQNSHSAVDPFVGDEQDEEIESKNQNFSLFIQNVII